MTPDQSKKLNAMCGDLERQIPWVISGEMRKMSKDEWRHFFCAEIMGNKTAPSIDGSRIIIFSRSSKELTDEQAGQCIELIMHFGDSKMVKWSDPELVQMMKHYEVNDVFSQ